MAKKDYASELAELRKRLENTEREAAELEAEVVKRRDALAESTAENERLKQEVQELEAAKIEIMRVKAHAYDLMMEREAF